MKNIEKYLVYVLLFAVAVLYILHFTHNTAESESTGIVADTLSQSGAKAKSGRIYYLNTDTVWGKYKYVDEISAQLEKKKTQFESQLEKEIRQFEQEVADFRQKGPSMSEVEVQIKQRDLERKQAELGKLSEDLESKFLVEEKEWNDKLRKKIVSYIDEKTKDRSYDYILGYSVASNIILTNDSLDLTREILDGLNEEYALKKEEK